MNDGVCEFQAGVCLLCRERRAPRSASAIARTLREAQALERDERSTGSSPLRLRGTTEQSGSEGSLVTLAKLAPVRRGIAVQQAQNSVLTSVRTAAP
jgi:hypothetical protein